MKKKQRWKRIPLDIIKQHQELLDEMLKRRRESGLCWPYLCDNEIKWKYGKAV